MMYKLKSSITCIAILLSFSCLHSQSKVMIQNAEDFRRFFEREIDRYDDSLSKSVKLSGTMFFKFNIAKDSTLVNVACSEKQPAPLINIVQEVLASVKIGFTASQLNNSPTYVLPLFYYYAPEPKPVTTMENLREQVPDINPSNLSSYINLNFNNFFNTDAASGDLWGINCVMLTPIKVARPINHH